MTQLSREIQTRQCYRRPCSDSSHVTAPYKLSFYYYYYYFYYCTVLLLSVIIVTLASEMASTLCRVGHCQAVLIRAPTACVYIVCRPSLQSRSACCDKHNSTVGGPLVVRMQLRWWQHRHRILYRNATTAGCRRRQFVDACYRFLPGKSLAVRTPSGQCHERT